ncbi:hypothetical protein KVR01_010721 [Diaporthe batatas]|uniref:uncharacterized protein n=1 Tax=Diaporthe batatas TaxID=748121 RepID=UPI001D04D804|nr:uncharacterized protein KVR01_010721 [Diaporthe batatas]KAG8160084.1 hypothetical protein KVR01_010721 [Diaporthe batatas]
MMQRCEHHTARPTRFVPTNNEALYDGKHHHQPVHQDINDGTSARAITDGPLRIHGTRGDPAEPAELGPINHPPATPTHPLLTPASWLFRILRAFCKGVGSPAKRPAAISLKIDIFRSTSSTSSPMTGPPCQPLETPCQEPQPEDQKLPSLTQLASFAPSSHGNNTCPVVTFDHGLG